MSPRFHLRPLSVQPDDRLVELAGQGDERAFEALVKRHRRSLAAYCRRIGLPEHRAEDVLQQALTRAWLALGRGAEVREPRAWLHRIVHNTALNAIRAERRHAHEPIELASGAAASASAGDVEARLQMRDALGHVAALPPQQRDALVLTAIEGRSHDEAADAMGLTDGAVRGLLYRARTSLRRAAAAFGPQGLLGWLGRGAGGEGALAGRTVEVSAGGAAAGAAGLLGKGAIATGVAALLAAGGTIAHLESGGHAAHRRIAAVASPRASASVAAPADPAAVARKGASSDATVLPAPRRGARHVSSPPRSGSGRTGPTLGGGHRRAELRPISDGTGQGDGRRGSHSGREGERSPEAAPEYTAATVAGSGTPPLYTETNQPLGGRTPYEAPESSESKSDDPLGSNDGKSTDDGSGGEATPPPGEEETQTRRDG